MAIAQLTIFNYWGYKDCEVELGSGEEPVEQAGPVLHLPEPCLGQRGELRNVPLHQVDQRSSQVRPDRLNGAELGGVGR